MQSLIKEITHSMQRNKLRTFLSAFAVAWGIILLTLLLGAGYGTENAVTYNSRQFMGDNDAISIDIWQRTIPYAGYTANSLTPVRESYLPKIQALYPGRVKAVKTDRSMWGTLKTQESEYKAELLCWDGDDARQRRLGFIEGKGLSSSDLATGSDGILLSDMKIRMLFPHKHHIVGETVNFNGRLYRVRGVFKGDEWNMPTAIVSEKTYEKAYPSTWVYKFRVYPQEHLSFAERDRLADEIGVDLRRLLQIAPNDVGAISISKSKETDRNREKIFIALRLFLWIIGISVLSIGIVGVSNIMMASVRERIKEIGIRKALGAKPADILRLVLGESVAISVISGLIGLFSGAGILWLINSLIEISGAAMVKFPFGNGGRAEASIYLFKDGYVPIQTVLPALIILTIAGIIAGYAPARRAIRIPAVEAMRKK